MVIYGIGKGGVMALELEVRVNEVITREEFDALLRAGVSIRTLDNEIINPLAGFALRAAGAGFGILLPPPKSKEDWQRREETVWAALACAVVWRRRGKQVRFLGSHQTVFQELGCKLKAEQWVSFQEILQLCAR
jgi:hypothetical protein